MNNILVIVAKAISNIKPIVLGVTFIIYAVISWILWFHWTRYGNRDKYIYIAQGLYFISTMVLLLIALVSLTN